VKGKDLGHTMTSPVVLVIFNRPSYTQRVFDRVREYKPSRLLVVADGPRSDEEAHLCAAARAVIEQVDWECKVLTNYSDVNQGCNRRLLSGLTWAFEQCPEAIILEDDCVPHPTFFHYCEELLQEYRHDERIMMINGCNFQFGRKRTPYSYYLSRYPHVWGWASWRRAWRYYNNGTELWSVLQKTSWLRDILADDDAAAYWRIGFDSMLAGRMTWDYQWTFTCWTQSGLSITPDVNLVSNVGFGAGATNATGPSHRFANLPTTHMDFPLIHPPHMVRDRAADRFEFKQEVQAGLYHRLRRKAGAALPAGARTQLYSYLVKAKVLR